MLVAPSRQGAPLAVARPDRASFLVAAPDAVLEVDGLGSSPALLSRLPCGGRVAQLGVSVSTETGQALLAAALESGLVELWDLGWGGGPGALLDVVHLPGREKALKAAAAKDGQSHRCLLAGAPAAEPLFFLSVVAPAGSGATAPTIHVLSASADGASIQTQRLDAVDASRKKAPAVALACHASRPLLSVSFADGVLHLYDTSRIQQDAGGSGEEGAGGAQLPVQEQDEHEGDDEEAEAASTVGDDEDGDGDTANPTVKLTKVQRQLLLVPIAALRFGAGLQGVPSCLAFSPGPDFLLGGTTGGQLAVWSISRALQAVSSSQTHKRSGSCMMLAKLMKEDNAASPLFSCDIPARASTGGVAVAVADFVGGAGPFVLAAVRDAAARPRRSSASRLRERRRSRGGGFSVDDDDDDDDDDGNDGAGNPGGKEQDEPVQYKAARVVVLAMAPDALAVVGTSQPVAEPVRMVLSSGHQGRVLVAGGATGAAAPPMRLVALADVVSLPTLGAVPAALAPGAPASWSAFLGAKGGWPPALTALSLQHRLQVSLPGEGPALAVKTMLMAQPLHALQKDHSASSTAAASAGAGAWGVPLPATLGELRAAMPSARAQLQQLQQLGHSTLLWPHRLEARAGLGLVTCRVVSPLEQPFALLPQQQPQQAQEQDGRAGFPTVVLLVRCASASGDDNAPPQSPLLYAAAGRDAAFTSDTAVALLSPNGGQVTEVRLTGAEWAARLILTGVDPPAYRIFPAADQSGLLLLAQGIGGSSATRLVIARAAEEGASAGWNEQILQAVDLQEAESVKEAAWQAGLLEHASGSTPTMPAAASVLGLLTSQRVLLLGQDLTVLAAVPLASSPPVHHLLWLGPALLLASAGHPVSYLDIDGRSGTPSLRPLCALDHRHAGARLLAALPDRLVYAARMGASGGSQILSRPLLPLEPLVVGALALLPRLLQGTGQAVSDEEVHAHVAGVLEAVVSRYGPAWLEQASNPLYAAGEGPGANAGVTGAVCVFLARAGFADLAAALAGVAATQGSAQSVAGGGGQEQGAYPRRPWVPSGVKAGLAAGPRGRQWMAGLAEALADDPAAREYALSRTSLSSAALPLRHRGLSHVLAALGEGARRSGHAEAALRLLDVAGEDEAVVSLLLLHLLGQGAGPASQDRAGLLQELFALKADPHVLALAEALWPDWRGADATGGNTSEAVTAALVGAKLASQTFPTAAQRRSALLPPLPVDRELPSWRQQAIARDGVAAAPGSGGTTLTGPTRAAGLRQLLLDRVEEWLGRGMPEGLTDDEEGEGRGEGAGAVAAVGAGEGDMGSMATWVKGVGQGREDEDNVVLYYRFGEMAPLAPLSTAGAEGGPPPQTFQGDISPYGHAVEMDAAAVGFEASTCPIDPGDEGKVRQAMDVVWRGAGGSGPVKGLRFRVPRGSALDVGPYHASGPRSKLTVELWIQRPEGAGTTGYEVLLCRRTSEDAGPSAALWSLGVAADGALALWTGEQAGAGEGTSTLHRTAAGVVPEGRWAHVAFTLETKGKGLVEVALFVGGKPAAAAPAQLRLPALPEARLRNTVVQVGPGLAAGSRLTELRVWALLRHADDLYDNRESYLKAAEKRKRLAFKIKGGTAAAAGGAGTGPAGEEAAVSSTVGAGAGPALLGQPALPAPAIGGIGMAPPPPPPAVARRRGLTPPTGAPVPAAKTAEGLQAPPALLPGPSVRRLPSARRASPTEAATPAPGTETAPASSTISPSPSSSSAATSPPPAVAGGWASDFESWEGASFSGPAPAPPPAPPKAAATTAAAAQLVVRPADLHVDPAHVLRDPMLAPAFSPQGYFLCFRERPPATAPQSAIVVLALAGPGAPRKMRYPFQSDSAIMVEGAGEAAEAAPLIACATSGAAEGGGGGTLSVYDLAQRKGVARQPASTQIVHWRWLAPRQLVLVTARAVFNWTLPATGASPPAKLFERRDGAGRRVCAYHQAGGWGLLLSEDAEQAGGVVAQLFDQERVRLYLESGGGLVGAGIGRCGCAVSPLSLAVVRRDPAGANVRLELYDLADAAEAAEAAAADSGGGAPASLLAGRPKLAEVTLPAPAVGTPPVWVFFPKASGGGGGGESASAIYVLFGGGGQGGLLASWRPPSGRGAGGEVTVSHPLVPTPGAALSDACLDARGEHLLVLQEDLSVWRIPLQLI